MSESSPSPFEEPKTNRWVWIIPSVLLHVVILGLWFIMPEPPPRMLGERELSIDPEQAEQLQEHVEESNLEILQANVEELQAIKERMEKIRAQRMAKLQTFEGEMTEEAPQDMAEIVVEIADVQQKIIELHLQMEADIRAMEQEMPKVRAAMERSEAEGIRAVATLASTQAPFNPLPDQFEELYLQITAGMLTLEQRLEWVSSKEVQERFTAYQEVLKQSEKAHSKALSSMNHSYRRGGRIVGTVSEDPEAVIEKLETFDRTVAEGTAKAESNRAALQKKIDDAEAEKAEVDAKLTEAREALKGIDRKKERDAWSKQQAIIKPLGQRSGQLAQELKHNRRRMGGIRFSPDRWQAKSTQNIRGSLANLLKAKVDPALFETAKDEYNNVLKASEDFQTYLEGSS